MVSVLLALVSVLLALASVPRAAASVLLALAFVPRAVVSVPRAAASVLLALTFVPHAMSDLHLLSAWPSYTRRGSLSTSPDALPDDIYGSVLHRPSG